MRDETLTADETACALLERELEAARLSGRIEHWSVATPYQTDRSWYCWTKALQERVEHKGGPTRLAALTAAVEYVRTLRKPLPPVESMDHAERLDELKSRGWTSVCPCGDIIHCGFVRKDRFIANVRRDSSKNWYLTELRTARALDGE